MSWKLKLPIALTIKGWDDWNKLNKTKWPIRFFLQRTIPKYFSKKINQINRGWWKLMHRFHPAYKYNIIKCTSLKPGYYDPETRMLHGSFDMFVEYCDITKDMIDWNDSKETKRIKREMDVLYQWWKVARPNRENSREPFPKLPKEWGFMPFLNEKYQNESVIKEWKRIADNHNKSDDEWVKEDNKMLIRLVKIRATLWYP